MALTLLNKIVHSTAGRLEVYSRKPLIGRRQWRWRIVALNNKIIAQGSESYVNVSDLWAALGTTRDVLLLTLDFAQRTHAIAEEANV